MDVLYDSPLMESEKKASERVAFFHFWRAGGRIKKGSGAEVREEALTRCVRLPLGHCGNSFFVRES